MPNVDSIGYNSKAQGEIKRRKYSLASTRASASYVITLSGVNENEAASRYMKRNQKSAQATLGMEQHQAKK
jgi:hypothetical protein